MLPSPDVTVRPGDCLIGFIGHDYSPTITFIFSSFIPFLEI